MWQGRMNWPMRADWKCGVCGTEVYNADIDEEAEITRWPFGLTWGLAWGICRCDVCHTQYAMFTGEDRQPTTEPQCRLKPEYLERARLWWEMHNIPIEKAPKEYWEL